MLVPTPSSHNQRAEYYSQQSGGAQAAIHAAQMETRDYEEAQMSRIREVAGILHQRQDHDRQVLQSRERHFGRALKGDQSSFQAQERLAMEREEERQRVHDLEMQQEREKHEEIMRLRRLELERKRAQNVLQDDLPPPPSNHPAQAHPGNAGTEPLVGQSNAASGDLSNGWVTCIMS